MRLVNTPAANRVKSTRCWASACDDTSITHAWHCRSTSSRSICWRSEASGVVRGASRIVGADAVLDRAKQARGPACRLEHPADEVGRRRLAVGAGDADHPQVAAWMAEEGRRQRGDGKPGVFDLDPRNGSRLRRRLLRHHRGGAAGDGLPGVAGSVLVFARQPDEQGAGGHAAGIVGQGLDRRVDEPIFAGRDPAGESGT